MPLNNTSFMYFFKEQWTARRKIIMLCLLVCDCKWKKLGNLYAVGFRKSAQLGNRGCADLRFLWISGHCFVYTFETIT